MAIKSIKGSSARKPGPGVFDCFAQDLFGNPDVTEWCEVGNRRVSCVVSRNGEKSDGGEGFRLGFLESGLAAARRGVLCDLPAPPVSDHGAGA